MKTINNMKAEVIRIKNYLSMIIPYLKELINNHKAIMNNSNK